MTLRWPTGVGRSACGAAVVVGAGAALGQLGPVGILGAAAAAFLTFRWHWVLALLLLVASASGAAFSERTAAHTIDGVIGPASVNFEAVVLSDPSPALGGWRYVVRILEDGPLAGMPVAVTVATSQNVDVGTRVEIGGRVSPGSARLHRIAVAGRVRARSVVVVGEPRGPIAIANALRSRVHQQFPADDLPGALMRGFLIGDTAAVDDTTLEEMRRAGLLHFVAVSGGNVAIFLAGVWLLFGLVPMSPRTRALIGVIGILVFVMVTRWEPSVLRSGLMLGLLLAGRIAGIPVDAWTALGGAATLLLVVAPQLVFDVGFQLSATATAGLLLGSHLWSERRPAFLWKSLGATLAAQVAVTPLLLWTFGSVPAFSAVANVAAAPLVTFATAAGWGRAFTGLPALDRVATTTASWVLDISAWAARLPQVGWAGLILVGTVLGLIRWRSTVGLLAAAVSLIAVSMVPRPPTDATAVFLDVDQGDAMLLMSPGGEVVAIDTGPDPVAYLDGLRRHGVGHIDLLVLTHSDGDHIGGLAAVVDRISVDRIWYPDFTTTQLWDSVLAPFESAPAVAVGVGVSAAVGDFHITAVSPARRYAADNDGSVVLWVEVNHSTLLLTGDIESVGQADLPPLRPDVMLVPHHGSATSDLRWLRDTVGPIVVLSYGDNSYGHPAAAVTDLLADLATRVLLTDEGDVLVRFPGSGRTEVGAMAL